MKKYFLYGKEVEFHKDIDSPKYSWAELTVDKFYYNAHIKKSFENLSEEDFLLLVKKLSKNIEDSSNGGMIKFLKDSLDREEQAKEFATWLINYYKDKEVLSIKEE